MYPYQNPDLSTEERISDLMSRMTLEEKILQTDQYYSGDFTTQDENGKVLKEGAQVVLGANDKYIGLCRRHWRAGDLGPDFNGKGTGD